MTQTAATLGISITPQGLDKRFTPICANFIKKVLASAVGVVMAQKPVALQLLHRFSSVYIQDSSTITLPDVLAVIWQGCGGSTAKNTSSSLKTQIRLNLNTGELTGPYLQSGKENDLRSQLSLRPMPKGSLWIADLGYFSRSSFKGLHSKGIYWLSRVKSRCDVYYLGKRWNLLAILEKDCKDSMDIPVLLGAKERLDCRLMAVRIPDEVARIRRGKIIQEAQRKGRKPTLRSLKVASFSVLCCNIPYELLQMNEAFVLMRTRWQLELLFKLWKNHGCIDEWRSEKPWRIRCEVYAKLIAMIIQHWILLSSCWQYPDRSLFKAVKTIKRHALNLASAFASGYEQRLHEVLETIQRCLAVGCRINKRKTKPHNYQLLLDINDIP